MRKTLPYDGVVLYYRVWTVSYDTPSLMRIAVSGTHAAGKSTLVEELGAVLSNYQVIEEPYYTLLDEGYDFADEPTVEDIETQLERSISLFASTSAKQVFFDRCPADFLGYLVALSDSDPSTIAPWVSQCRNALDSLDLVIYIPIERPDRIAVPDIEGRRLRKRVDAALREMLVDDAWGFGAHVLEVRGTLPARVQLVLSAIGRLESE